MQTQRRSYWHSSMVSAVIIAGILQSWVLMCGGCLLIAGILKPTKSGAATADALRKRANVQSGTVSD
jgi:hypothetical protein